MQKQVDALNAQFNGASPLEVLRYFLDAYRGKIALASSMGAEDQVLTDMLFSLDESASIFTIDTGRLHPETYRLLERTNERYQTKLTVFFPRFDAVEELVNTKGVFSFFDSLENRKECCFNRKIEPLKRALAPLSVWITGLRRSQAVTRTEGRMVEWDEANGLLKLNPLIDWSDDDVWDYIKTKRVPYNELHDKGFPSIGCEPCTRAVQAGEDIRAGRWWWEAPASKECGLHKR